MQTKHADYEVVRVEEDRVFIVDLDLGNTSVTNDVFFVSNEIKINFPNKRLIYRDTLGNWDEIVSAHGAPFFIPYMEHIPNKSEITRCPTSALIRKHD